MLSFLTNNKWQFDISQLRTLKVLQTLLPLGLELHILHARLPPHLKVMRPSITAQVPNLPTITINHNPCPQIEYTFLQCLHKYLHNKHSLQQLGREGELRSNQEGELRYVVCSTAARCRSPDMQANAKGRLAK